MDKNKATIEYLLTCDSIKDTPLYFNFIQAKDDNKQFVTMANDKAIDTAYIDGSVLKRYTFTIIVFKSISYLPIPKATGKENENIQDLADVQTLIDWIKEQHDDRNFPDFGEDCVIEDIRTTSDNPNLNSIDTSVTPALARYSISIQIDYLDKSNSMWNK